jgi:broad specificity phosphatase PhoE
MAIKLVRHGQSAANANGYDNAKQADCHISLTDLGQQQAEEAGRIIGSKYIADALIYCSPYARTRATLDGVIKGAGIQPWILTTYEDPRLREVEHGYHDMYDQMPMREIHGSFFYRMQGGESRLIVSTGCVRFSKV